MGEIESGAYFGVSSDRLVVSSDRLVA